MADSTTPPPARCDTRRLKTTSVGLPESSIARAMILALPDAIPFENYLDKAEALTTVLFAEIRNAEAARDSLPVLHRLAKVGLEIAEAA